MSISRAIVGIMFGLLLACMWHMHQHDTASSDDLVGIKSDVRMMRRTLNDLKNEQARLPGDIVKAMEQ